MLKLFRFSYSNWIFIMYFYINSIWWYSNNISYIMCDWSSFSNWNCCSLRILLIIYNYMYNLYFWNGIIINNCSKCICTYWTTIYIRLCICINCISYRFNMEYLIFYYRWNFMCNRICCYWSSYNFRCSWSSFSISISSSWRSCYCRMLKLFRINYSNWIFKWLYFSSCNTSCFCNWYSNSCNMLNRSCINLYYNCSNLRILLIICYCMYSLYNRNDIIIYYCSNNICNLWTSICIRMFNCINCISYWYNMEYSIFYYRWNIMCNRICSHWSSWIIRNTWSSFSISFSSSWWSSYSRMLKLFRINICHWIFKYMYSNCCDTSILSNSSYYFCSCLLCRCFRNISYSCC